MEQDISQKIEALDGNFRARNHVFISKNNIKQLVSLTEPTQEILDLLITPFLINTINSKEYELHYYEVSTEVTKNKTEAVQYLPTNILAKEITENLTPKLYIQQDDYDSFKNFLKHYLDSMEEMTFPDDEYAREMVQDGAELFYEII